MPDLTTELAATCATNTGWSTTVRGSKGDLYTVRFCYQPHGVVQYDYECTCPAFKNSARSHCKHIRQIINAGERCGWNEALEPALKADNNRCPRCGGPVLFLRVGV